MTRDRWDRVEELLNQAVELPDTARADYLRANCGGDEELRLEVESLLEAHERTSGWTPGVQAVRSVLGALETEYYLGRKLGSYEIESFLGSGGTGLVYQARDTMGGRIVALKVFFANCVPREAEGEGQLHPSNVKLFELGTDGDTHYLVMEYVEGETVARRIERGPISPGEVLRIAGQIADGLGAAHKAGLIHGDLKPANLMIDAVGQVRILDFGLGGRAHAGTPGYRAPEQVEGKTPDSRSDVYSFGVVLHEMLTGKRPPGPLPLDASGLRAVISRCLQKDPQQRFENAGKLIVALHDLRNRSRLSVWFGGIRRAPTRFVVYLLACAVLMGGLALQSSGRRSKVASAQFTLLTDDASLAIQPAISPDGRSIAYASNHADGISLDIWVQEISSGRTRRLTSHPRDDVDPSFSPDGKWIVYASDRDGGGLYRTPSSGGKEERIAPFGYGPRYSPDGRLIIYSTGPKGPRDRGRWAPRRIHLVPAGGGSVQPFHPEFASAFAPIWSPDGRHLLFAGRLNDKADHSWWLGRPDASQPVAVAGLIPETSGGYSFNQRGMAPKCWLPSGELVFQHFQGSRVTFMTVPFSIQQARFKGIPRRIAVGGDLQMDPSCGPDGEVAFASIRADLGIWGSPWSSGLGVPQAIAHSRASNVHPSVMSNGKRLVFVRSTDRQDVAISRDLESGLERQIGEPNIRGLWLRQNADGSLLARSPNPNARIPLEIIDAFGKPVRAFQNVKRPWDFSADARYVLAGGDGHLASITLHRLEGEPRLILTHPRMDLRNARFSPDGRWIAFTAQEGEGPMATFVAPFQGEAAIPHPLWISATLMSAGNAEWAPDGQQLFFVSEDDGSRCIWTQRLDVRSKRPVGAAYAVQHFHHLAMSLFQVPRNRLTLAVSHDKVFHNLSHMFGGIWLMR